MRWIQSDGYHETHQLVMPDGRIVGTVTGSRFRSGEGWWATSEKEVLLNPLGRYQYLEEAKRALLLEIERTGEAREI